MAAAAARGQSILYVDDDAPGGGDGLSWAGAHRFLSDAMAEAATPGSDVIEVRIAGGLYVPDRSEAAPNGTGDRLATFLLPDGIPVIGGYAGLAGADPDERDIEKYETILSGDLAGDDEPGFVNNDENSYHVAVTPGEGTVAILDGLTVTAGHADGDDDLFLDEGAGVLNHGASLFATNCTFSANASDFGGGGVLSSFHGDVTELQFTGCTFSSNTARAAGGLSFVSSDGAVCTAAIDSCVFVDNFAEKGGGGMTAATGIQAGTTVSLVIRNTQFLRNTVSIYGDNDEGRDGGGLRVLQTGDATLLVTVTNCEFTGNTATGRGGGASMRSADRVVVTECTFTDNWATGGTYFLDPYYGTGGGLSFFSLHGPGLVSNCTFTDNRAGDEQYFGNGGGLHISQANSQILNCVFNGNAASKQGGGLYDVLSEGSVFRNCRFIGNSSGKGGGIYVADDGSRIIDCTFLGNTATEFGGAIWISIQVWSEVTNCLIVGNDAPFAGALGVHHTAAPIVTNCTILNNTADVGGAWFAVDEAVTSFINCIVRDNGQDPIAGTATPIVSYCNVEGGYEGAGNIDADAKFMEPPSPGDDGIWGTDDDELGNLRLRGGSPCIDAGDSTALHPKYASDWGGQPRFVDDPGTRDTGVWDALRPPIDMGALEFQGVTVTSRGDIDGDGDVDAADLAILLGAWGPCPSPPNECHADLDGDGEVGPIDLDLRDRSCRHS